MSGMTHLPSMPLFVSDFDADTSHLSFEEDGAYNRLLRLCWRTPGCSVPDDAEWITRRLRTDAATYARLIVPLIEEFFTRSKGRIWQKRQRQEYEYVTQLVEKRKAAGIKGGNAKALKSKDIDPSKASILPEQNDGTPLAPTLTPTPIQEEAKASSIEPRKRGAPKTTIPPDAVLGDGDWTKAQSKGLSREEAEAQFERFRDNAIAHGRRYADWRLAWSGWLNSDFYRPITTKVHPFPSRGPNDQQLNRSERSTDAFIAGASRLPEGRY
jgi:uncharacterized protein YdaU (DUF1376 family)